MKNIKRSIIIVTILLVIAFLFLFIFSSSTSPLYNQTGLDSIVFRFIGKGLLRGEVPYKNMFDHKGPILYLIQASGAFISPDRIGIFLVQVINLTLVLFFVRKISLLYTTQKQSWLVIFLSLCFLLVPLEGGNLTEEYSLLFLMIPTYLFLKDNTQATPSFPLKHTFVYGLCFTTITFIRVTNATAVIAIVFSILIFLIINKQWRPLFNHIMVFIGASLIIIVPLCTYFYSQGALYDMIFATFLINFKYVAAGDGAFKPFQLFKIVYVFIPVLYCMTNAYLYQKRYNKPYILLFSICLSALSLYVSLSGRCFFHYQAINIVLVTLGASLGFIDYGNRIINKIQRGIIIAATLFSAFLLVKIAILINHREKNGDLAYPELMIPEEDKDRVIAYNLRPDWYTYHDVWPCHRYFFLQDLFGSLEPQIWEEFNEMMTTTPPLWIITRKEEIKNKTFERILSESYLVFTQNEKYIVYRYFQPAGS